jgi:glycosyltransferase involved in cell wall biosynthesis
VHVGFGLLTVIPGRMGGSETSVRGLLEQYAGGNGPERVTVLANRLVMDSYGEYARGPVSLHPMPSYPSAQSTLGRPAAMLAAHALPRRLTRELPDGLDVIHFPVTVPVPRTRLTQVVTLYDLQHHDLPRFFSPPERVLRRLTYDAAAQRADIVITTSSYSRSRIVELLGIPEERVEVVPLGIDQDRFSPETADDDARLLAELGLARPFVVYPANLWPHKNHARLIEALALAPNRELELVLTGATYGRLSEVRSRARRAGVEERVRHLGYVAARALPALYRAARAMVFPSLYEGFGTPPLEAMACGCPVAASMRTSLAEVCGDAAVELDPESAESIAAAIERVCGDEELRSRLVAAGRDRAASFTWQSAAAAHIAAYKRAAAA